MKFRDILNEGKITAKQNAKLYSEDYLTTLYKKYNFKKVKQDTFVRVLYHESLHKDWVDKFVPRLKMIEDGKQVESYSDMIKSKGQQWGGTLKHYLQIVEAMGFRNEGGDRKPQWVFIGDAPETPQKDSITNNKEQDMSWVETIKAMETDDYQRRKGNFPSSNIADSIQVSTYDGKLEIEVSFKNTSEKTAKRWAESKFLSLIPNSYKYKTTTYQDGDYHDDWVVASIVVDGVDVKIKKTKEVKKPETKQKSLNTSTFEKGMQKKIKTTETFLSFVGKFKNIKTLKDLMSVLTEAKKYGDDHYKDSLDNLVSKMGLGSNGMGEITIIEQTEYVIVFTVANTLNHPTFNQKHITFEIQSKGIFRIGSSTILKKYDG